MYIASLANVSYVYFETDMDNDGVWLDLEFNVIQRKVNCYHLVMNL